MDQLFEFRYEGHAVFMKMLCIEAPSAMTPCVALDSLQNRTAKF
jgi:hypothetical protein